MYFIVCIQFSCFIETLHEAFENLDKLAEKSFDSFVRALVDVLTLVNGSVNDKVRAAKEMHRQMNSPSERFAKIQMQKWKDLDKTTKTHVEVSVSTGIFQIHFVCCCICICIYSYAFISFHIIATGCTARNRFNRDNRANCRYIFGHGRHLVQLLHKYRKN